jgi:hypothetical protein
VAGVVWVRQRALLPVTDSRWEEVVPNVVGELQQEGLQVYLADDDADRVDLLFVLYEARDHSQIETELRLQNLLTQHAASIGRLLLCACDLSRPRVSDSQVRDLLIAQNPSGSQDRTAIKAQTLDSLREEVRVHISRRVYQAGLMKNSTTEQSQEVGPEPINISVGRSLHTGWGSV